jgi:ABC-type transporter Mla subunit MlaD
MKLSQRSSDALVGLLVLGAGIILATVFIVTRGWNERRITIYMRSPSVQDLKLDAPVKLLGMQVGEVATIAPLVDSSLMGPPEFVVALRLRERYADGTPLVLPRTTRAEMGQGGVLTSVVEVSLLVPANSRFGKLEPGDTIRATIRQSATEALKEVADSLKTQVSDILRDTRQLLVTLDRTATSAEGELHQTGPEIRQTLADARSVLTQLGPVLASASGLMDDTKGRLGTLQDSLAITMAEARVLMQHLDTLAGAATLVAKENREGIRQTTENIRVVSIKMEYLIDQLSRRPLKVISGVQPLPHDSVIAKFDSTKHAP